MPRPPTTSPSQQFGPPITRSAADAGQVQVGDAVVHVQRAGAEVEVAISAGDGQRLFRFDTAAVTRWCADGALLLSAALGVAARDEVELRTPMLVATDGQWIALSRHVAPTGSTIRLLTAPLVDTTGLAWSSTAAATSAGEALIRALRDAAGSAAVHRSLEPPGPLALYPAAGSL